MSTIVAGAHNGSEPPPNPRQIGHGCRGVGGQKAIRGDRDGGKDGGRKGVLKETRNLVLKKAVDEYGVKKIKFEWNDQGTMLQIGPNAAQWSNLVGKLVREFSMHYPSWSTIEASKKAHIIRRLMEEEQLQYEEMIKLRDLGADTSTGVPYIEKEILAMVRKGKQQGHIPGVGTYTEAKIDDMLALKDKLLDAAKKEAKWKKQEIDLPKRVVMSDDRFS
ncbi:hypothetical protein Tco_1434450 [Tanacetum coccineum]